MKNLFFEIKNYLIVLSLFIFLFLALIFFPPIPDGALGSDYEQKEVTREKVLFTDNRLDKDFITLILIFETFGFSHIKFISILFIEKLLLFKSLSTG